MQGGVEMTDIEIARNYKMKNIAYIARKLNIPAKDVELYGKYKAKINLAKYSPKSKLIWSRR